MILNASGWNLNQNLAGNYKFSHISVDMNYNVSKIGLYSSIFYLLFSSEFFKYFLHPLLFIFCGSVMALSWIVYLYVDQKGTLIRRHYLMAQVYRLLKLSKIHITYW